LPSYILFVYYILNQYNNMWLLFMGYFLLKFIFKYLKIFINISMLWYIHFHYNILNQYYYKWMLISDCFLLKYIFKYLIIFQCFFILFFLITYLTNIKICCCCLCYFILKFESLYLKIFNIIPMLSYILFDYNIFHQYHHIWLMYMDYLLKFII